MTVAGEPGRVEALGIGYTIATGRLFCDFGAFQRYCEALLGEPVLTHEFADKALWKRLREACEEDLTYTLARLDGTEGTR